jgi:hypothetical protein
MQNWGKFSLFAIRVLSEVQIVLLQDAWCTAHTRAARACTKLSVWCDGAEMNIFSRCTPAKVASPAARTYQEKQFFLLFQLVTRYMTR